MFGNMQHFWQHYSTCQPVFTVAIFFYFYTKNNISATSPLQWYCSQGLLFHEVSRSHNDEPQSVGLLWTSDQLVAETST
jgi:hypothetical protein